LSRTNGVPTSPLTSTSAHFECDEVSEDIVLGPPKTAFASAGAKNANRTFDSPNRASFTANDEEGVKGERQNFRDRYNRDGPRNERDGEGRRDNRPESLRLRRDDNERWGASKTPKTPFDESERAGRRNGDREQGRDKDSGREVGRNGRGFDDFRRNGDREGNGEDSNQRRNGQQRGRNEPSWYRNDDRPEVEASETGKDTSRRDWRDRDRAGGRGPERDWNKGGKPEREPEWITEPQPEESKQAHTQEDFQRWKERMKASNATSQETPASPEPIPNHERTLSGKLGNTGKIKVETPLVLDSAFNGFFSSLDDTRKENIDQGAEEQPKKALGKPSKFTGFFAPKPESKAAPAPAPASAPLPDTAKDSSNEDKEGFQRILKLLDQQQSSSSRNINPFREQPRNIPQSPPPVPHTVNPLESILAHPPSQDRPTIPRNHDSEFLLQLMQQTQSNRPTQPPPEDHPQPSFSRGPPPPGLHPFQNLHISPHPTPNQPPTTGPPLGFFTDIPHDKPPHRKSQPPPLGFFDDFPSLANRPPGLDMFPLPQQQQPHQQPHPHHHQQQQRQPPTVQPPPGFQHQMRISNAFPQGLLPRPDERAQQFGGRAQGMPPPPGFFAPPPGFPPVGFGNGNGGVQEGAGFGRGPMEYGDFGAGGGFGR